MADPPLPTLLRRESALSLDTSNYSSFTELANPNFDLRLVTAKDRPRRKTLTDLSSVPLREMLVIQPPLGKAEKLPRMLSLHEGELSATRHKSPTHIWVAQVGFYVPVRHILMLDLVQIEMADPNYSNTHGTYATHLNGCTGPLCRRARREYSAEHAELGKLRTGERQVRTTRAGRYQRLKSGAAQYAAVEPLLFSFTVVSHLLNRPRDPNKESEFLLTLDSHSKLHAHLRATFGSDVNI